MNNFFFMIFMLTCSTLSAQINVSKIVTHNQDAPSTPDGCVKVSLKVDYFFNGIGSTASSNTVTLNQNTSANLSVNIPGSSTIRGKFIIMSFDKGSTFIYEITDGVNTEQDHAVNCRCKPVKSRVLQISETATEVSFYLTDTVSAPSCN